MSHDFLDRRSNTSGSSRNNANEGPAPTHEMLREYLEQRMRRNEMLTAQMFARDEEDDKRQVQQKVSDEESLQRKGEPGQGTTTSMPADVQGKMENSFGTDFSGVNIHKDSEQANALGAFAYTQGSDVHFAPGQYNPGSQKGQELIGHELTHVVQQREGRVKPDAQQHKGVNINSDPALEKEADEMGAKAAQGKMADVKKKGSGVQRQEEIGSNPENNLFNKYQMLFNRAVILRNKTEDSLLAWEIFARNVGSVYATAMNQFKQIVESKKQYEQNIEKVYTAVLSSVAGGMFSYVAGLAKSATTIANLSNNLKLVAETGVDTAKDLTFSSGKEAVELFKVKAQSAVSGELPLVYQNNLMKEISFHHWKLLDGVTSIHEYIYKGQSSLNDSRSNAKKLEQFEQTQGLYEKIESHTLASLKSVKNIPNELNHEFQRGFFKGWIPSLKSIKQKTSINARTGTVTSWEEADYDTWLGSEMENHFVTLGIINEDFGWWTSDEEVKALIKWASNYQVKNLI